MSKLQKKFHLLCPKKCTFCNLDDFIMKFWHQSVMQVANLILSCFLTIALHKLNRTTLLLLPFFSFWNYILHWTDYLFLKCQRFIEKGHVSPCLTSEWMSCEAILWIEPYILYIYIFIFIDWFFACENYKRVSG